jgi:hypothetical protein
MKNEDDIIMSDDDKNMKEEPAPEDIIQTRSKTR